MHLLSPPANEVKNVTGKHIINARRNSALMYWLECMKIIKVCCRFNGFIITMSGDL